MDSKISSPYKCKSKIRFENHLTRGVTNILSHMEPVKIKQERPVGGIGATFKRISSPMMDQYVHESEYMQLMSAAFKFALPHYGNGCEMFYPEASMKFPHTESNVFVIEDNPQKNSTSHSCDIEDANIKPKYTMKSHVLNPEAKEFIPSKFQGQRTKTLSFDKVSAKEFDYINTRSEIFFASYSDSFEGIKMAVPICTFESEQVPLVDGISFGQVFSNFSIPSNSSADEQFMCNSFSKNSKMNNSFVPKDYSFKFNNPFLSPPSNNQTCIDVFNQCPPDTQSRKIVKELDSDKENFLYVDPVLSKSFESMNSNSQCTMKDIEEGTIENILIKSQDIDGDKSSKAPNQIINENNGIESKNCCNSNFSKGNCSIKDGTRESDNDNDEDNIDCDKEMENNADGSSKCPESVYKHDIIREEEKEDRTYFDESGDDISLCFLSNYTCESHDEDVEEKDGRDIDESDDDGTVCFISNESGDELCAEEEEESDDETDAEEEESDDETDAEVEEVSDDETDAEVEELSDDETDLEEEEVSDDETDVEESDDEADGEEEEKSDDETDGKEESYEEEDESDNDSIVCFISNDTHDSDEETDFDSVDYCGVIVDDSWDNDEDINCDYNCDLFEVEFSDDEFTMPCGGLILANIISLNSNAKDSICDSICNSDELDSFVCNVSKIDSEVVEANKRWNEAIDNNWCLSTPTKVQFSDDVQIYLADEWCRKGPWEVCARDRMRFQRRIEESELILNPVLSLEHRFKVLNRLRTSAKK